MWIADARRNNISIYPDDWKKLPIPKASREQQNEIKKLVDDILLLKHTNPSHDISAIESTIDDRVAALYGL